VDHTVEDVVAAVEEEDIPTGTTIRDAITTPVATPMGMTTYGLDIVVKLNTHTAA
jgi:hypothetical protein